MRSQTFSVPVPGGSLRVRSAEVPGTPMLLIHGGPGGTDYLFKFLAKPLADAGYQAIGYIQRGSQGSPNSLPIDISRMRDDIDLLRSHMNLESLAITAHSWGGLLSTAYAAAYPQRLTRLVLLCPMGARRGWQEDFDEAIEQRLSVEQLIQYQNLIDEAAAAPDTESRDRIMGRALDIAVRAYYSPAYNGERYGLAYMNYTVRKTILDELNAWYRRPEWNNPIAAFHAPTRVLYGEDDVIPSWSVRAYGELIPHAAFHPIPNAGHFPWIETPADFLQAYRDAL